MPRSGTTVTHNCLRGHPSISAFREEVEINPFFTWGMATFTNRHPETEPGLSTLLDAMTSIQPVSDSEARGVKITTGSKAAAKTFVEAAQSHLADVRIIHVVRHDVVARFGSWVKSRRTGVWKRKENGSRVKRTPEFEISRHDFADYAVRAYQTQDVLRQLQETHEVLELSYEDIILEGKLPTYEPFFEFVDVEPMEADWLSDRKLSPPPESYIKNYHELSALREELWSKLKKGADPKALREAHARPLHHSLWGKAKFWAQRPGYAMYCVEKAIRSAT